MAKKKFKDYPRKASFEKAFREYVPNFDECKMWFIYTNGKVELRWAENGKLQKFSMYKSEFEIDRWCQHFIEFFETGKFEYAAYWKLTSPKNLPSHMSLDDVHRFPMHESSYDKFCVHSKEMNRFLTHYRHQYGDCGITVVRKPKDWVEEDIAE